MLLKSAGSSDSQPGKSNTAQSHIVLTFRKFVQLWTGTVLQEQCTIGIVQMASIKQVEDAVEGDVPCSVGASSCPMSCGDVMGSLHQWRMYVKVVHGRVLLLVGWLSTFKKQV